MNLAILKDFDEILTPKMVVQSPLLSIVENPKITDKSGIQPRPNRKLR